MKNTGKNYLLEGKEGDAEILKINSPEKSVKGPYKVVFKNIEERWQSSHSIGTVNLD